MNVLGHFYNQSNGKRSRKFFCKNNKYRTFIINFEKFFCVLGFNRRILYFLVITQEEQHQSETNLCEMIFENLQKYTENDF